METRTAAVAVAVSSAAALVITAAPATADERTRTDRSGDAPAAIDATRATYRHTAHRVSVRIKVPDLGRRGRASLAISRFEIFEAGYVAVIHKRPGSPASTRLLYYDHFDDHRRACDGLRGSWTRSTGTIRISVPRACLAGHRTTKVYAAARTLRGSSYDDVRAVKRLARG